MRLILAFILLTAMASGAIYAAGVERWNVTFALIIAAVFLFCFLEWEL